MWNLLNIVCFLTIFINGKTAVGRVYKRLKSHEGRRNECRTRLAASVFKMYCTGYTLCDNDKACKKPKEICVCDEHCGKVCVDPTSTCTDGYCKNGGTCADSGGSANCSCPANFTGATCEQDVDECAVLVSPCKNGGTCSNHVGGYVCRCISGWDGFDCAVNIDDCASDGLPKCDNGGSCFDRVGTFFCYCTSNYTGLTCQHENQCETLKPCHGDAQCRFDPYGGYSCQCSAGWTGQNCSTDIDECGLAASGGPVCHHGGTCANTPGSYSCNCIPGYTGQRCESVINECSSNPCQNGGTCIDYPNMFICLCKPGWTGSRCGQEINECYNKPCQNGGQCHDLIGAYKCTCVLGYSGPNCETNIDDCGPYNPCLDGATCIDGIADYTCSCATGFTGRNCDTNVDDCQSSPCQHYGTCVDGINEYSCTCVPGYTGKNCEMDFNECASNPCLNGGTCQDVVNGFKCVCPQGTNGTICEHNIDDCLQVACQNGGTCIDGLNEYLCDCHSGFHGRHCGINFDECGSSPCRNGGSCTDGVAQYHCQCQAGFTGKSCETRIDSCLGHFCANGATCHSQMNGYRCSCLPGYTGQFCEIDVNECLSGPCNNGSCFDGINEFTCDCYPGFTGLLCEQNINDCQHSPCLHGSTCHDGINDFACTCPQGFSGRRCEHHLNECISQPCQNGATCVDKIGSYSCYCKPGYMGQHCETTINWCQRRPCKNGGTCKQTGTDFQCICPEGFTGVICDVENITCSQAKMKSGSSVCQNGGTCVNDMNNIQSCNCPPGFTGSYCEVNINDCARGPCKNGANCIDGVANYTCSCVTGFTGRNCDINIDDCAGNPCRNGGTCTDLVAGFICSCPLGYVGNTCEINPNDCMTNACFNGGFCQDGLKSFTCQCRAGFSGLRCEVNIDECSSNPCSQLGTEKCFSLVNDYRCKCKCGFLGKNCEININECLSNPCQNNGQCQDGSCRHTCFCPHGFSGVNCERRVSSCDHHPCLNNGTCQTLLNGSYACNCMPGVTGRHCEMNIDECDSSPCHNDATCVDGYASYSCICPLGYTGKTCLLKTNDCASSPCLNGGTCEDLMGYYKCKCPATHSGDHCETEAPCPFKDCAKEFNGKQCKEKCNNHACNYDGTRCSLGQHPWQNCSKKTSSGEFCYSEFKDEKCNPECNTEKCLFDGFDCINKSKCSNEKYCNDHFGDAQCDRSCNTRGCLFDGLDCSTTGPQLAKGTLILVLRVTPRLFREGARSFMRQLSEVLETVAFIKRDRGGQMIYSFDLNILERSKREAHRAAHVIVRRASEGTKVHVNLDTRGCTNKEMCIDDTAFAARYLGALQSSDKLHLPYEVHQVGVERVPPTPTTLPLGGVPPLYIAMLCVGIPLFIVGVLAGAKRVYAKLWVPDGFPGHRNRRQQSTRRDPVGQEVSLRSINKGSEIEENNTNADGESSRSDLTPPREAKRAKHDDKGEDSRQWTRLHHQVADMTARSCQLALTPPQEGSGERGASAIDVDAKGPGGMTALHLAACRGTYGDGSSLDDDKDSDDSGAAMVSDLLNLGAKYAAKTDTEETPLHLAARYSRADVAKRLLDSGADANSRDRLNRTPLHLAIGADAQGVFQILLRNRATDLEAKMDDGTSPLILASRHDLPELVRHLVKAGVKVNSADNQGRTALHWAASVNSLEVTKELLRNGAKKDAQDEKGQTPLFLGCREGSNQTVRHLLVNYANRKLADNMDMTPEDIAKQRHHHDIVELLTDWSLGCNSPKAVPAPTSPPEGHQSPRTSMASPPATSPPAVEILTGSGPAMVARFQAARPKTTAVNRSQGTPRQRSNAQGNNSNAKRKRKKARNDEESYPVMTSVATLSPTTSLSPIANHAVTSCATGPSFSPSCVPMANGLPPLGSVGISPADSTTFSPVQGGPNPLDTQEPPSPLEILSPEDLKDLEIDVWDGLDNIVPFDDPADMPLFGFPPTTATAGNLDVMDHIVPTTSDCMYLPNNAPLVRRVDPPQGQRLYSVHSTPDLNLLQQDSRPTVFNGRTCSSAQKAPPTPSQLASYHALTNSNMYPGGASLMPPSKDFSISGHLLPQQLQGELYVRGQTTHSAYPFPRGGYDCVSPQKPLSFPTPSPDSPGQWSSSSSSSSC